MASDESAALTSASYLALDVLGAQRPGDGAATGGSPGAAYLRTTLFRAPFPDRRAVRRRP